MLYFDLAEPKRDLYIMYETYKVAISQQGIEAVDLQGCPPLVDGIRRDISSGRA